MNDPRLWYEAPAATWTEALPVGNGRLGAMVFGGIGHERLQLNEDTLYAGGPYSPVNHDAFAHLGEVRDLLFAGRYAEAEALSDRWLMGRPLKQMPYQPAGDLWIDMPDIATAAGYRRQLDLRTATATTRFTAADGTYIERTVFATAAEGVLVVRLATTGKALPAFAIGLSSEQAGKLAVEPAGRLRWSGRNAAHLGIEGVLSFVVEARLRTDGRIVAGAEKLSVDGASWAEIILDAATSYRRFDDVGGDPLAEVTRRLDAAGELPYDALLRRHVADHERLFSRLDIDLGPGPDLPTDRRIAANPQVPDASLAALFVQYGRYLLIASSRPGTQPANLQGIWNDLMQPPWDSKYTTNINLQMNYWLADPANLGECFEPLVALLEDLSLTGRETARVHYRAPGWVLHHNTDLWRATAPIDGAKWGLWPLGGAWLCAQAWDHVQYGHFDLIERLYPILVGAAEFIAHILTPVPATGELVIAPSLSPVPATGELVIAPSLSPENVHPHGAALCYGPAMDSQIIRDLFEATIDASRLLDRDPALRTRLLDLAARLPRDRIGHAGQLQEWLEDWDMEAPEIHHRHVSHLYGLYPSRQIAPDTTPALATAARRSLDIRGDDATGWGIGWRINLWARLGDAERAHAILQRLLSPERTYPNMFDAHPPFQIDGNFGGAAGVLEMLAQSRPGEVLLLPALPSAWPRGHVKGLRARGGIELDLTWDDGRLIEVRLAGRAPQRLRLGYAGRWIELDISPLGTRVSRDAFSA